MHGTITLERKASMIIFNSHTALTYEMFVKDIDGKSFSVEGKPSWVHDPVVRFTMWYMEALRLTLDGWMNEHLNQYQGKFFLVQGVDLKYQPVKEIHYSLKDAFKSCFRSPYYDVIIEVENHWSYIRVRTEFRDWFSDFSIYMLNDEMCIEYMKTPFFVKKEEEITDDDRKAELEWIEENLFGKERKDVLEAFPLIHD